MAVTHRGAAGDGDALFGPTLDDSFNAGAERAVDRRPHVSFLQERKQLQKPSIYQSFAPSHFSGLSHPVDLVSDSAVLHLLHLHVGQALLAALVALATARA